MQGRHISVDTKDCLIVSASDRLVATVGVEGLVVIDTGDTVLICRADEADGIRALVEKIRENGELKDLL